MQSINSFLNLLGKNYYSEFLINVNSETIDFDSYIILVKYNGTYFYELNNNETLLKRKEIIIEIKEQYQQALNEIYSMLLSQDPSKLNSYLDLNIKAVKSHLNILKKDFYIDSNQSRYYSIVDDNPTIQDLETVYQENLKNEEIDIDEKVFEIISNTDFKKVDSFYYLGFLYQRYKTLSFLPFALFQIGKHFILELDKIKLMNKEEIKDDTINSKSQSKMEDTYFKTFCEVIDDCNILSKSTAFGVMIDLQLYIKEIKSETLSELLEKGDNKNDYLDFKINEVEKQNYPKNADLSYVQKWLNEYKISIEDIFNKDFQNNTIEVVIAQNYKDMDKNSPERDKAYWVQLDFYQYFCKFYADELIAFFESRKNKIEANSELIPNKSNKTIKWIGKPSQLGFIIGKLAELGYIDAPKRPNGETNFSKFASLVNNTFEVDTTDNTLSKYLNLESEKGSETVRKFNDNGFDIPHIKTVS